MKSSSTLLLAIALASGSAWAQTQVQAGQPPERTPSPDPNSRPSNVPYPSYNVEAREAMPGGEQSSGSSEQSGASGQSAGTDQSSAGDSQSAGAATGGTAGQGQSEGQLITREIANSRNIQAPSPVTAQPQTQNGITYVCGGVGEAEETYMKQAAKDYDMKLTFATKSGSYVSDVKVSINDAKGKEVLQTTCGGPIMLVDLPRSGSYRVRADAGGRVLDRSVRVVSDGSTRTAVFTWPRDVVGGDTQAQTGRGQAAPSSAGGNAGRGSSGMDQAPGETQSGPGDQQEFD